MPNDVEQLFLSGADDSLIGQDSSDEDDTDMDKSESVDTVRDNRVSTGKRCNSSTELGNENARNAKRSPISVEGTPNNDKGSTSHSAVMTSSVGVPVVDTGSVRKKLTPIRKSATVPVIEARTHATNDGLEGLLDDPREEMINMDNDALDNLPIFMWAANHSDMVKKIARQEVMIAALDGNVEKAKEEAANWERKAVDVQIANDKLTEELNKSKQAEELWEADRRDNERLEKEVEGLQF